MEDDVDGKIVIVIRICFSRMLDAKSYYHFQLLKRRLYENHDFGPLRPIHPGEHLGI